MAWNRSSSEEAPSPEPQPEASRSAPTGGRVASLGPSISIKGNLTGQEDLVIEGRVEGEISLKDHSVTIGGSGRVKADIYSKGICVEGEVSGNLYGSEEVIIRKSGRVEGNATAPRVTLENGAKFRGSIDMQPQSERSAPADERRGRGSSSTKKPKGLGRPPQSAASDLAAARPARS